MMGDHLYTWRKMKNAAVMGMTLICALITLVPLFFILYYVTSQGITSLNLDFFTHLPKPVGEPGGGMANAILGSGILLAIAAAVGIPPGVFGGIYLSEYGQTRLSDGIRFAADVLIGVPSIVVGIFVYALIVLPMHRFSALAGGVALGIIIVPIVMRTTEESLKMVPTSLREASLALGAARWQTIIKVVLSAGRAGVITGVLLALARVAGETAPLLFTALNNRFWSGDPRGPMASLPVQIYTYAIAPYDDWHRQAWAGAFVLIVAILGVNIAARLFSKSAKRRTGY
jgi:phosphate transport system permease protein